MLTVFCLSYQSKHRCCIVLKLLTGQSIVYHHWSLAEKYSLYPSEYRRHKSLCTVPKSMDANDNPLKLLINDGEFNYYMQKNVI